MLYQRYYVNDNPTFNPGYHHEVHTEEHANQLNIRDKSYVGYYTNEKDAVAAAKRIYADADGCIVCCPKAHIG